MAGDPGFFGCLEPAEFAAPAAYGPGMQRVRDIVGATECLMGLDDLVDIILFDEDAAEAKAIHLVVALVRRIGELVRVTVAGIIKV